MPRVHAGRSISHRRRIDDRACGESTVDRSDIRSRGLVVLDRELPGIDRAVRRVGRLAARLRRCRADAILNLIHAVEARDPYTEFHSVRVACYSEHLARPFRFSAREAEILANAALLHDIGKIGIPDAIVAKQGPLTHDEYHIMKGHPAIGATILQAIPLLDREAPLVLHHHEWYDGRGYPAGLSENSIPIGARILQVADSIDAMLSPRNYKIGYNLGFVIDELKRGTGTQFDPAIAESAVHWLSRLPNHPLIPGLPLRTHA